MRKADPTEQTLDALRALRESGDFTAIPQFLKNKSGAVVAKAAELSCDQSHVAPLIEAFRRIQPDAVKRDPGCRALTAIAKVLLRMDANTAEVFTTGIKHQQWEPSYGPPFKIDTACELRGVCALGLVSIGDPEALIAATDLLNDHCADARIGAARALGASSRADAELVLRFKAAAGDQRPEVIAECFTALLHLTPKRNVEYVAAFLPENEDAALALGESKLPEAVPFLINAFPANSILLALALSRQEPALDFVMAQLETARPKMAAQALEALSLYKSDELTKDKVRQILDHRQDPMLEELFQKSF